VLSWVCEFAEDREVEERRSNAGTTKNSIMPSISFATAMLYPKNSKYFLMLITDSVALNISCILFLLDDPPECWVN